MPSGDRSERDDQPIHVTCEPGKTVTCGYDSRNRVTSITDWTGRTTGLEYDGAGRLKSVARPNGTVRTNTWDLAGQLTMVRDTHTASGDPVVMLRMEYDAAGRLESKFEVPPWAAHPGLPARLASHTTGAWEGSGEMPPNVRQHPKGDMSGNEGVNWHADNQLTAYNGQTITHDLDGNILSAPPPNSVGPLANYTWTARNQLASAPGNMTYMYDADHGSAGALGGDPVTAGPEGRHERERGSQRHRAGYTANGSQTSFVVDPHGPMSRVLWRIRPDGTRTFYLYGPVLLYEIEESASGGNPANAARF